MGSYARAVAWVTSFPSPHKRAKRTTITRTLFPVTTVQPVHPGLWTTSVLLDDYDVRGAVIVGESQAVVWDTLSHPRDMQPVASLTTGRPLLIVYSHADWDHAWGTAGLDSRAAVIIAHESCLARFSEDVPRTLAEMREKEPGRWSDVVLVPPTRTFDQELRLDLGGLTLVLRHLPGHTRDSIVGFIPEHGVLLAGDTVETPCPVVPGDGDLAGWIAGLREWTEEPGLRTVIPAHGPTNGPELLRENVRYLEGILEGRPIEPGGPLTGFYEATHRANVAWRPGGR